MVTDRSAGSLLLIVRGGACDKRPCEQGSPLSMRTSTPSFSASHGKGKRLTSRQKSDELNFRKLVNSESMAQEDRRTHMAIRTGGVRCLCKAGYLLLLFRAYIGRSHCGRFGNVS